MKSEVYGMKLDELQTFQPEKRETKHMITPANETILLCVVSL